MGKVREGRESGDWWVGAEEERRKWTRAMKRRKAAQAVEREYVRASRARWVTRE